MKNFTLTRHVAAFTTLAISALIAGCHHDEIAHGEKFYEGNEPTRTGAMAQAQCATGAKEDAMLYDRNFHGTDLNSLGQGKLDLIVKGTPVGDPVTVYLNMPHDAVAARQEAVTAYLKTAGIKENKIIVAEGPNPNTSTPTAYNIGGLYKADGTSLSGAAGDTAPTAGGSSGSSAMTAH
jgi:hypothetical protein